MKVACEISLRANRKYAITVTKGKKRGRAWSDYKNIGRVAGGLIHSICKNDLKKEREKSNG